MPTIFSHALAGAAIAQVLAPEPSRKPLTVAAAMCAMLPDADTIGLAFGVAYESPWGHRGITHSLLFAALAGAITTALLWKGSTSRARWTIFACLFAATASHGLLDMLTDGGRGVALFAPFDNERYFFPWTPIRVSPIGVSRLFTRRFLAVLISEFIWVWIPSIVVILLSRFRGKSRISA